MLDKETNNALDEVQKMFDQVTGRTDQYGNQPVALTVPTVLPESQECISQLVLANGNLELAAERMHIAPSILLSVIASDPTATTALYSQFRVLSTINMMTTLTRVSAELNAKLGFMSPNEMARTYADLNKQIVAVTDPHEHTENVNINQAIFSMLPPQAREALKQLMDPSQPVVEDPSVIEADVVELSTEGEEV